MKMSALFRYFFIITLLQFSSDVFSQDVYFKINGICVYEGKPVEFAQITIFDNDYNDELTSIKTKNKGNFGISTVLGFEFRIEIKKRGFITQKVIIKAKTDSKKNGLSVDLGKFELFKNEKGINKKLFDSPVLIVALKNNEFVVEKDEREIISKDISTYLIKEKLYNRLLKEAYGFMQSEKYESAKKCYEQASNAKPNEEFPKQQLEKINELTNKSEEQKPTTEIEQADESEPITESLSKQESEKDVIEIDEEDNLDDYLSQLSSSDDDNKKQELSLKLGKIYQQNNQFDKALSYLNQSLDISEQTDNKSMQADVISEIATVYFDSGVYELSLDMLAKSLQLKHEANDRYGELILLTKLGQANSSLYRNERAIEYYQKSYKIAQELGKDEESAIVLDNISSIYYKNKQYDKAITTYEQSIEIEKKLGNTENVAVNLNNIGIAYYDQNDYEKAESFYKKSLVILEQLDNKKEVSMSLNNIGNVNYDWEKYNKALDYYQKSLSIKKELNYKSGVATSLYNIGNIQNKLENYEEAIGYFKQSISLSDEIDFVDLKIKNLYALSEVYKLKNNTEKALEYYKLYSESKYSLETFEPEGPVSEILKKYDSKESKPNLIIIQLKEEIKKQKLLAQYESERNKKVLKLKNIEIHQKEQEVAAQKKLTILFSVAGIIFLLLSILLMLQVKQKQKANKLLKEQKRIAEDQRDQIANQKREITDSINYAQRIQQAVLPKKQLFEQSIQNHFIYFQPKDIVSGDFYWMAKKDKQLIIAIADCTGHGVPGGFMSMLGIAYLNDIVSNASTLSSDIILNELRNYIIHSLHQTGEDDEAKDGMDISLVIINENNKLQFSGANNPLYLIRNNDLTQYKANKMPIGISGTTLKPFSKIEIELQKNDRLYMFSDGFLDQFGGPNNKKFSSRRFRELLMSMKNTKMKNQGELLKNELENWKNNSEQIDDILVFGFEIS